jgi:hypothetical protein
MLRTLIKWRLILSCVLLAAALWKQHALPDAVTLDAALLEEPSQLPTFKPVFDVKVKDITYHIKPLYNYDISGLVVSKHNADTWWDYLHREWNDHLNITDLCVVWGNNVRNDAYQAISFWSEQFTCNFSTRSSEAFAAFDQSAISNNHLLTDNPYVAKVLRNIRIGDQVRIRGYLAEYSHNHGLQFKRGSSTVRNDTGNGACETIFVDSVQVIKVGNSFWRILVWVAAALIAMGVVAWFAQPVRFND